MRRDLWERDPNEKPEVAETPVPFSEVALHQHFFLRPAKYVGMTFIKTGNHMAEWSTWDDHAPMQSFAGAELVYPVVHKLRPKT